MRSDMFKVIVERPRSRGWKDSSVRRQRRQFDEDGASRAGMRAGIGRVFLNENLKPLKRYLLAQAGRPWDKVWSEIAANIDRRSTVQEHIYSHIHDFVAVQVTRREDGTLIDRRRPYPFVGSGAWTNQPLYVDPRTGLVRRNPDYGGWRRRSRARFAAQDAAAALRRRSLGDGRWHLRLDGEWFEVILAPLPPVEMIEVRVNSRVRRQRHAPRVYDVVMKRGVSRDNWQDDERAKEVYGARSLHATHKRQLSKREIEKFGLPR